MVFALYFIFQSTAEYSYPKTDRLFMILTLLSVLPSLLLLLSPYIFRKHRKFARIILLGLCAYSIPVCFILSCGITSCSETTSFYNYRDFDSDCLANRDDVFQELFPSWPHYFENVQNPDTGDLETEYLDAHYYYRYLRGFDYTYDIYAEWPLEQEEFDAEVARVTTLFQEKRTTLPEYIWNYQVMQKGSYQCLILYDGGTPFTKEVNSYTYYIFAYDKKSLKVRYIMCDSLENGADQPYYLQLDW